MRSLTPLHGSLQPAAAMRAAAGDRPRSDRDHASESFSSRTAWTIQPNAASVTRSATNVSATASRPHLASFAIKATAHPALIPHEVAASSRPPPAIPATTSRKALLAAEIPAYPRSGRKRHDRPVTPEVAGSSPVAPVKTPVNPPLLLPRLARTTAGLLINPALIPHAGSRCDSVR